MQNEQQPRFTNFTRDKDGIISYTLFEKSSQVHTSIDEYLEDNQRLQACRYRSFSQISRLPYESWKAQLERLNFVTSMGMKKQHAIDVCSIDKSCAFYLFFIGQNRETQEYLLSSSSHGVGGGGSSSYSAGGDSNNNGQYLLFFSGCNSHIFFQVYKCALQILKKYFKT